MWLATEKGFYSIVKNFQSSNQDDEFIVRARKETDLSNLFPKDRVLTSKNKDYAYRVFASRMEVNEILSKMVEELEYTNFKDHIKTLPDQNDKLPFYAEIWGIMNRYQSKFIKALYNF